MMSPPLPLRWGSGVTLDGCVNGSVASVVRASRVVFGLRREGQ